MKDLISIIIPVYNAEKYLEKCIESILVQTYKEYELILVDDGSKDNSGKICDAYAEKDGRIRVIHKKNAGVSAARNTGIENAKGEFIAFVDSDDWLEKESLEILHREIIGQNADLAAGAFERITRKGNIKHSFKTEAYTDGEIAKNIIDLIGFLCGTVWAKLFRRNIITNEQILFNPEIPMGEDSLFLMTYMQFCKKIVLHNELVYNYNCLVEGSAARKFYEKYDEYFFCVYQAAKEIVKKADLEESKRERIMSAVANRFCCITVYYYITRDFWNDKVRQKTCEIVERYEEYVNENLSTSFGSTFSPNAFELLVKKDVRGFFKAWNIDLLKRNPIGLSKHYIKLILMKFKLIK